MGLPCLGGVASIGRRPSSTHNIPGAREPFTSGCGPLHGGSWLQQLTVIVPARWAVDGLDAMTWRGIGWQGAVMPTLVLLGFAAAFGAIALLRFRWEEA